MQTLTRDTTPAAEARQISILQQRQPHERIALTCELTAFSVASSLNALRRAHPQWTALDLARLFASLQYGDTIAERIQQAPTIEGIMSIPSALRLITHVFAQLRISYYVGGSIASTAYSLPRSTFNIDIAADIQPAHVAPFVAMLETEYYIERSDVLDALLGREREALFNITHYATGINIAIFVTAGRPFDEARYQRAQDHVFPGMSEPIKLASPEDVILNKLVWYRQDGIESQKQWRDVGSIVRVQAQALDLHYLRQWSALLDVATLLEAALRGDTPPEAAPHNRVGCSNDWQAHNNPGKSDRIITQK